MIINVSRGKAFQSCEQYAYNWDELRLYPHREADPLIVGEGYHYGSEVVSRQADVGVAIAASEEKMRARYAKQTLLPEEQKMIERNIEWVKHAVAQWAAYYDKADFRVLWPEVSGCVPLPGTEHHCWFAHRLLHGADGHNDTTCINTQCWIPHHFAFRTDGVIEMYKHIWLLEQKTTSSTARNNFWIKFQLSNQIRGYCYGVWKATGVLVDGALVNAIVKHSTVKTVQGVKSYELDPFNVGFEREPILVGKQDLLDFEREISITASEYERKFSNPELIVKNPENCFDWNRKCYYWDRCKRFNQPFDGEFSERRDDYVNLAYYELLGLPAPGQVDTDIADIDTSGRGNDRYGSLG